MASRKSAKKVPKMFTVSQERAEEGRIGTMGRAEDMRKLVEDTINSFDAREATRVALRQGVVALKQETATTLNGFRRGLKTLQMDLRRKAADLKRFLANTLRPPGRGTFRRCTGPSGHAWRPSRLARRKGTGRWPG